MVPKDLVHAKALLALAGIIARETVIESKEKLEECEAAAALAA